MEYLKIWTSFVEILEPLNDSERGRLFTAMLEYAGEGTLPEFKGNERFSWPAAKQAIDRARAESEKQTANGSKGGRPKKNPTKPNETQQNPMKPNETQQNPKDNIKKDKEKKNNTADAVYTPATPAHCFGSDLSDSEITASLESDRKIEDVCRDWGLPCNPGNMIKARELAREYSLEWLLTAIERAGNGKSQTWSYVEGILRSFKANGGVDSPGTGHRVVYQEKRVNAQKYAQREYTEEELLSVSDDLIAEARAMREGTA